VFTVKCSIGIAKEWIKGKIDFPDDS
jgi:hypothetical protein